MNFAFWGGVLGFVGVASGAFGAHALRTRLEPRALEVWQTAAHYQLVHAVALVAVGIWVFSLSPSSPSVGFARGAGLAWFFGVVVFSGSLYALALTDIRWLGAITPIGGVGFLVGWILCAAAAWKAGVAG